MTNEPSSGLARTRSGRCLRIACGVVVVLLIGLLIGWRYERWRENVILERTPGHARQLVMALKDFETEYGRYPDASTASVVMKNTGTLSGLETKTSNDLFRQLFVAGIVRSEAMFYAPGGPGRKPDNSSRTSAGTLAAGECQFAYIPGASSKSDPERPLLIAPVTPGSGTFGPPNPKRLMMVDAGLKITWLDVDSSGRLVDRAGRDVLDPTRTCWQGVPPEIKWPE